ncbi:hypothetical protein [Pseudonocardia spinosispora]|uniref:hypothetical protein n=1 Tax=Pseudonocardia spinosispora TaxID=103441 RepID=UPI00040B0B8E|nr:hypothetical protein [Pseudonocardia spinosispora]
MLLHGLATYASSNTHVLAEGASAAGGVGDLLSGVLGTVTGLLGKVLGLVGL